jgi:type II secretion system protein N
MGETGLRGKATSQRTAGRAKTLGLFVGGCIVLIVIAILLLRPYSRLERIAADAFNRHAPRGATVGGVSVTFPFNIVLTDLAVPIRAKGRNQIIEVKELSGKISILSLFSGELKVGMNGDFFGGTLWLDIDTATPSGSGFTTASQVAFDARARGVDMSRLSEFLELDFDGSGFCDADIEGEVEANDIRSLSGRALAIGRKIRVSSIDLGALALPANTDVDLKTRLAAQEGKILIDALQSRGSAYDLKGKGTVHLSEPLEQSAIECSFSTVFKQPPTINDQSLADAGAEYVLEALVDSEAEVFFTLTGVAGRPELKLDPSSSIGALLRRSGR